MMLYEENSERVRWESIVVVTTLVMVSCFVVMPTQIPTVKAYITPGTGVVWNFDDLVANSGGDVVGGGGNYVITKDLTVKGVPTQDTIYTRDNERIYVSPGVSVLVNGIFLSQAAAAPVTIESDSLAPLPGDWGGFEFSGGSVGRFENTEIRHARRGIQITDADVTLRNTLLELCYPDTVYFQGGLLHVNNSMILGSEPPVTAGTPNGGGGMYITGPIVDTLWINQSTITGGNAYSGGGGGSGGYAIFTLNAMGPMGLIGNDLIQGGNGGFNNVDSMSAGGGGLAFHAFPVWDMGPMPSINISGNTYIKGGNGGLNNASFDGGSGWGSQGIIISDNDYTGTVVIANNMEIYGGDGGDNFANWNAGFTVGNGGPGIVLDNVGGLPTRIRNNGRIFGGKGGNNSGASMIGGAVAGMGGRGANLGDTRNVQISGSVIVGGHGGNNTLAGMGTLAGNGGIGLYSSISQNLTVSSSWIYGGEGGDDYAGMGPGMMAGPGIGAEAIRSNDNWGNVIGCFAQGGEGGDNFGQMGEGRIGGAAVLVEGLSTPTFNLGTYVGGKGGDNYNDSGIAAGQGNYAFIISGSQRVNIWNSDIAGGDGGDAFLGANALPGNGMSAIVADSFAWAVNIADNPMITVGQAGTNFITGAMGAVGSFGIEADASTSGISILRNYITGASFSGVYSASPGTLIDGNTIEANWMGVYLEPTANWANITNNPRIGGGFLGISTVQPDNLLIRNNLVENTDVGIAIAGSQNVLIDRTWILNATTWGMRFQTYADKILVENSTITGSMTWDFSMNLWSNATTLNTAFDGMLVDVLPDTRLTVKNYLDVKVLDQALSPLPSADVEVLDNGAQVYATPGFGGGNATTDIAGEVDWIVVTDRIYFGNPVPTENVTDAQVAEGGRTFVNNPRAVDMSLTHQEVFFELGADPEPPEVHNVLLDGVKFRTVTEGTPVTLNATLDDTVTGNSNITVANYTIGPQNWPGAFMTPWDGSYDTPVEDVYEIIDTTGWMPGPYDIWVYGCDDSGNCNMTGDFATLNISGLIDNEPPEVRNVLVDGMPSVLVLPGTVVTLTADLNDTVTGGSNILSANYTIGAANWPGAAMVAIDGLFDEPVEGADAAIDTTGWTGGTYEIWVYGCDALLNCNMTGDFATIIIPGDSDPPEIYGVTVDGLPLVSVPAGTIVVLDATVDDTLRGGSIINGANYTIGMANWPGIGMNALDGMWDSMIEDVTAQVDTTSWNCGLFDLYAYGWDDVPNYNTTSGAFATINITVCDFEPPMIQQVWIDGSPTQTYFRSLLPATFLLTAVVNDVPTGGTAIGGANYTSPAANWPGTPMNPLDGAFNTSWEEVELTIPTPTIAGTYEYCVYGWDQVIPPNYNTTGSCATLDIVDDVPPNVWNVFLDGSATLTVPEGTIVSLDADIDDSVTGGSNIWDANWTFAPPSWPGTPMSATDGAFDSQTEGVNTGIDTSGWIPGSYDICVNARDVLDNQNITCQNFATLTVTSVVDNLPPEISNVMVDGLPSTTVNEGDIVLLTADIDDSATGNSNIAGANYTEGVAVWPGTPMSPWDGAFNSPTETVYQNVDTTWWGQGTHIVCVYAWDNASNVNVTSTACAQINITVDTPPIPYGTPTGTGVSISTDITLQFNESMDTASVNASFSYTDLVTTWGAADGSVAWSLGDTMMTFDPALDLDYETTYIVILNASIAMDLTGNYLDGNADGVGGDNYVFAFKTEVRPAVVDTTQPDVVDTDPEDEATDVPVDVPTIEIEFDEPMNEDLINVDVDGVQTQESWDGNTLIITPLEALEYDTTYTVSITNAEDLAGNSLGTFSLTFTTETEPEDAADTQETDLFPWMLVIILVIIIIILGILLMRKGKREEGGVPPSLAGETAEETVEPFAEGEEAPPPMEESEYVRKELTEEDNILQEEF